LKFCLQNWELFWVGAFYEANEKLGLVKENFYFGKFKSEDKKMEGFFERIETRFFILKPDLKMIKLKNQ